MKTIILGITAVLFSLTIQAQNKNVKSEVKTTVTTVKDSQGEKKIVKTEKLKEVQNIELKDADSNALNKEIQQTPVQVISTTAVTADGVTNMVDIDRSAYYELNGQKYQVTLDQKGYNFIFPGGKEKGVLRKTKNNNYIYKTKDTTSFGYFNSNGDLVLETYDDNTDQVKVTTYIMVKE